MIPTVEVTERQLPANLEAERSVLGAILLHNEAYEVARELVGAGDFFRDAHRRIFASIDRLLEWKGGLADLVTLKADLGKTGELEKVGGPAYIASLVDGVPRSTNTRHYAQLVKEQSRLRALIHTANKVVSAAYADGITSDEIIAEADRAIIDLQNDGGPSQMLSLHDTNQAFMQNLEWRHTHRGEVTGIDTGFPQVNDATMGWQRGDLVVIAARPSIGKTSFVLNTAVASARAKHRVAMFSLEMRRQQLEYRILASLSGVPLSRILSGCMMEPDWGPLSQATETMSHLPLRIDDRAGQTVWDVRTTCRRLRSEEGLDLVVIDYVQLMSGSLDRRGASRNEEMTDISRRLKTLADEVSVPILLLSQMNRANEKRNDPRPKLSDLRESGALEQDADIVGFLHRRNHREGGLTYFILEKQRNGATGTLKLSLDRDIVTFTDAPDLEEPVSPVRRASKEHAPAGGE